MRARIKARIAVWDATAATWNDRRPALRCSTWIAVVLLVVVPCMASAQGRWTDGLNLNDPRTKRSLREKAVTAAGPVARSLVETYGEPAVFAIFECTRPTAAKLAQFNAEGKLSRFPRPELVLWEIGRPKHGDAVALFAMHHCDELADETRFRLFLSDSLTYSLSLKSLDSGVAEYSARVTQYRRQQEAADKDRFMDQLIGVGVIGIVVLLAWRYRNRYGQS
jgi:hypothetical protein